jgi:hypothetical protein
MWPAVHHSLVVRKEFGLLLPLESLFLCPLLGSEILIRERLSLFRIALSLSFRLLVNIGQSEENIRLADYLAGYLIFEDGF